MCGRGGAGGWGRRGGEQGGAEGKGTEDDSRVGYSRGEAVKHEPETRNGGAALGIEGQRTREALHIPWYTTA